jgi:hypothetical protein
MIKFPSIEQLRNVVKNVEHKARWAGLDEEGNNKFDRTVTLPKLKFRGTVKLHGTNAGIVKDMTTGQITFQSRERELELTSDNAGFMLYMSNQTNTLNELFGYITEVAEGIDDIVPDKIVIFGEWCGGSIQKSVALNQLEKMFVVFAIRLTVGEEEHWMNLDNLFFTYKEARIFNILDFPTWEMVIDFEKPHEAQNELIKITEAIEAECPVGRTLGVSGIGEGAVWSCITPGWESSKFWMKIKGEKHQNSKVKTLAAVDVEAINSLNEFVDSVVTENRLEQGLQNLVNEQQKPFVIESMGDFIRWVYGDVIKEETDTIVANQLDPKKLGGPIANKARKWYIQRLDGEVFCGNE